VHHDDGQTTVKVLFDLPLGQELGSLVVAHHVAEGHRSAFARRSPIAQEPQGAYGARVNNPMDLLLQGLSQDDFRAVHIVLVYLIGARAPEPVVRSHVKDGAASLHGAADVTSGPDITLEPLQS